ncbi:MAG: hypothetical protein K2K82_07780 [Muribaculaceae bacterium]|nr:hypothetical protein [Muribaculaceae bacterium]
MGNNLTSHWFWVVIALAILLGVCVAFISQMRNYNKSIKELNSKIERLTDKSQVSIDVHGIKTYVAIIAYIAITFCLGVIIHYLAVGLPRIQKYYDDNSHKLVDLGVDYLGLIVAIFSVIVTLLVGWQILSTIKTREELKSFETTKDEFEEIIKSHKIEIATKIHSIETNMIKIRMDTLTEIMLVVPLCISAHKEDIDNLSEALRIYGECKAENLAAGLFSRETAFGLLRYYNAFSDDERKKAIELIKKKCDKNAIVKLYSEYLTYSDETKAKHQGVNDIFLELLKD